MALPVRHKARLTVTEPLQLRRVTSQGWAADHYFQTVHESSDERDPYQPPMPRGYYWAAEDGADILTIPELRGAILAPRSINMDPAAWLQPVHYNSFAPSSGAWSSVAAWWDKEAAPAARWRWRYHEASRKRVAYWSPPAGLDAEPYGYIRTRSLLPAGASFRIYYQMMAPEPLPDGSAREYGLRLYVGINGTNSPAAQYILDMPNPSQTDESRGSWRILRQGTDGLYYTQDKISAPSLGAMQPEHEPRLEWLDWIYAVGHVVIRHSRSPDQFWVYNGEAGAYPRMGWAGLRIEGARTWVGYELIHYAATASLTGRWAVHNFTDAPRADSRVDLIAMQSQDLSGNDLDVTVASAMEWTSAPPGHGPAAVCRPTMTLTNTSPTIIGTGGRKLRTPILFNASETHFTRVAAPATPMTYDLAPYLQSLTITVPASRQGQRAEAVFRTRKDWFAAGGSAIIGMAKVVIDLAGQYGGSPPDDAWSPTFTGYVSGTPMARANHNKQVSFSLVDRAGLWADGASQCVSLPDFSWWYLEEAVEVVAQQMGMDPATEVVWPAAYETQFHKLRGQYLSSSWKPAATAAVPELLNRMVRPSLMTWWFGADDKLYLAYLWPAASPSLVVQPPQMSREQAVLLPLEAAIDLLAVRSAITVQGRDAWGQPVEGTVTRPDVLANTGDNMAFTGRERRSYETMPDCVDPVLEAHYRMWEQGGLGVAVGWTMTHQPALLPRMTVEFNDAEPEIPDGTLFVVTEKVTVVDRSGGSLVAEDRFTAIQAMAGGIY